MTNPNTPALPDARRATDDGYIWPVRRGLMTSSAAIGERMVEDITIIARQRGLGCTVTGDDLADCGWSRQQIAIHGPLAGIDARRNLAAEAA